MKILIFMIGTLITLSVIFFPYNNIVALTIGDSGQLSTVYCYSKQSYNCMITETTYYANRVWYTITITPGLTEITEIPGTQTSTYAYFPDSVDKINGWGIIDGFIQFFENDPLAPIKVFTDDSSLIFNRLG